MPKAPNRIAGKRFTEPVAEAEIPLEKFITYGLLRLTNRLNRQSMRLVADAGGLGLPEWRCLAFIGGTSKISLNEIYERTRMDRGLISRSVQSLVDKGLVLVERDQTDRRLVRTSVTKNGRQVYRAVLPVMQARQLRLLECLSDDDRTALYRIMDRLNCCLDDWSEEEEET